MKNDGKRIKIKSNIAKDAGTTLNKKTRALLFVQSFTVIYFTKSSLSSENLERYMTH